LSLIHIYEESRDVNWPFERQMTDKRTIRRIVPLIIVFAGTLYLAWGHFGELKSEWHTASDHAKPNHQYCRKDIIFKSHDLQAPILFAHRGGVLDMPESTEKAFSHALNVAKVDVLELDVQLTKDAKIVVWHGPDLDNVYIEGQSIHVKERPLGKRNIYEYDWFELSGKAWVADPGTTSLEHVLKDKEGRELLLLSQFLNKFPTAPLNIELKSSFKNNLGSHNGLAGNIAEFVKVLDAGKYTRDIIVASASYAIIEAFRTQSGERYVTNLTWWEQLKLFFTSPALENRALETVYHKFIASEFLISKVRRLGGATYVFLTAYGPFPSIDVDPQERQIMNILDRGVDGIMTDSPSTVRTIINTWKQERCTLSEHAR
jgi:glycerophosphoryl diester phosphodiesterase